MCAIYRLLFCALLILPGIAFAQEAQPSGDLSIERSKLARAQELIHEERQAKERGESAQTTSPGGIGITMLSGLCVSLGVLCLLVFIAKKLHRGGFGGKSNVIKILERVPLGAKCVLALVEVEGKKVLLSYGSDHVTLLEKERPQFSFEQDEFAGEKEGV